MKLHVLVVMVLAASTAACEQKSPTPTETTSATSATLKERTLVYESEQALQEAHRFVEQGDKESFALLASTRATRLPAGTRVTVIGSGDHCRRIEVADGGKWWVEPDFLSP